MLAVAGGVTFYGLLSLFPAITVLVSLYGLFADPGRDLAAPAGAGNVSCRRERSVIIGEQVTRITESDQSKLSLAAIAGLAGGAVERQCRHEGDDGRAQHRL